MVSFRPVRGEDIEEAVASGVGESFGFTPDETRALLSGGMAHSIETRTYVIDGDPVCVMGVMAATLIGDECHIWMYALPLLAKHPIAFARHVPALLADLPYSSATCLCDPAFTKTVRWLSRLGFAKVGEVEIKGRPFDKLERNI